MKKLIICILLLVIIVQYHFNRTDQSQANPGERPQVTTIEQVYELTKKLDTVVGYIYQQQSYEVYLKDWRNHTDPRGG